MDTKYKIVFSLIVVLGFLEIFLNFPLNVPDEIDHFARIYQIMEGKWFYRDGRENLPMEIKEEFLLDKLNPNIGLDYARDVWKNYNKTIKGEDFFDFPFINTIVYHPFLYLPQVIVLYPFYLFYPSPVLMLYIGRIAVFLLYVAFLLFVFYKYKKYFLPVFIVFVNPQNFFYATSITLDTLVLIIIVSYVLHVLYITDKGKVDNKDLIILSILSFFIGISKFVYFPISFFAFIYWIRNGKDKKIFIPIFIAIIAGALYSYITFHYIVPMENDKAMAILRFKDLFSFSHWIMVIKGFYYGKSFIKEMVGLFGLLKYQLPNWYIGIYVLFVLCLLFAEKNILSGKEAIFTLFIIFIGIIILSSILYVSFGLTLNGGILPPRGKYILIYAILFIVSIWGAFSYKYKVNNDFLLWFPLIYMYFSFFYYWKILYGG